MYHKKNIDFAYLLWEDFVYQVEHKDAKKSNEMYYPRDDQMFTTIKLVLIHQNTQQFGAILPIELTNKDIKNSAAYREYYVIASGAAPPKTKASVRKTQSSSDTTMPPPTTTSIRHLTSAKGKQPAKSSKAKGLYVLSEVALTEAEQMKTMDIKIDQQVALDKALVPHASRLRIGKSKFRLRSDITSKESTLQLVYDVLRLTPFYKAFLVTADVPEIYMQEFWATATVHHHSIRFKVNNKKRIVNLKYFMEMLHICLRLPNQTFDELLFEEEILAFLRYLGHSREIGKITNEDFIYQVEHKDAKKSNEMYYPRDDQMFITIKLVSRHQNTQQFGAILPIELTNEDIRNSAAYKEYYATALGAAPPKTKASKSSDEDDDDQDDNDDDQDTDNDGDDFVHPKLSIHEEEAKDEESFDPPAKKDRMQRMTMKNCIETSTSIWKEHVKVQVSKILPKIEKIVNKQLEAEVLTRSSNSSKTSYAVAAGLSKMELKMILIEKIESNKSIHRADKQRNLYKALVDAYECDKIILDTYEDTVTLKRCHDDADKDEEPSARLDRGSKRRREGKEPESTSDPKEKASKTTRKSTEGSKSHHKTASESAPAEKLRQTTQDLEEPSHQEFETDTLTPELIAGPTYELKKGSYYGRIKWIEDLVPRTMWSQELVSYDKYALWGISHWGCKRQQFYGFAVNREDDNKLYKFKEGDFKRLRIQDIEDMLLLLVQGKLKNLTIEERFAFNVSLRMFTRSIIIQRRVEDLQLGVEIYQKKLNLTKPDTYHSDLKRKEAYTTYSNPRGFIYPNDVRTALDDCLKGIRMKYLPQTIWRKSDKEKAATMI
nr:hypothetical protein [Tanacetum cinerariifolium]